MRYIILILIWMGGNTWMHSQVLRYVENYLPPYFISSTMPHTSIAGYAAYEGEWIATARLKDESSLIKGHEHLERGLQLKQIADLTGSLKEFVEAGSYYEQAGCTACLGNINGLIGSIYFNQGNNIEALSYIQKAVEAFNQTKMPGLEAAGLRLVARYNVFFQNYPLAFENYKKALAIYTELGNKKLLGDTYSDLAMAYFSGEDFINADENEKRALAIRKAAKDSSAVAISYHNLAVMLARFFNYPDLYRSAHLDSAEAMLQKAFLYNRDTSGSRRAELFETAGDIQLRQGDFEKAKGYYAMAISLIRGRPYPYDIFYLLLKAGDLLRLRRNFAEAKVYFEEAFEIGQQTRQIYMVKMSYDKYVGLDTSMGNYEEAFRHQRLFTLYQDSVYNVSRNNVIAEMQSKFDLENKRKEIEALQEEKNRQHLIRNVLLLCLGLIIILSVALYKMHITKRKLELQTLRNKIASDLHDDIGSTLSSISIFSEVALNSGDYRPHLMSIGDSSRKMLDAMGDIVWTINPDNDDFENIILRMKNFAFQMLGAAQIDFEFDVEEGLHGIRLPMETRKNVYLIFKEAVNNLVKYSQATEAHFALARKHDQLVLCIKDNGIGFASGRLNGGNGLRNMEKRAQEMGGNIDILSAPSNGTKIVLEINVIGL